MFVCGAAPAVSYVAPDNMAMCSGGTVTISGLNFAATDLTPTTGVVSTLCTTTSWTSGTSVSCHMRSSGSNIALVVPMTVTGVVGTGALLFTFDGADGDWTMGL